MGCPFCKIYDQEELRHTWVKEVQEAYKERDEAHGLFMQADAQLAQLREALGECAKLLEWVVDLFSYTNHGKEAQALLARLEKMGIKIKETPPHAR